MTHNPLGGENLGMVGCLMIATLCSKVAEQGSTHTRTERPWHVCLPSAESTLQLPVLYRTAQHWGTSSWDQSIMLHVVLPRKQTNKATCVA